jgi:hypothetical protein
MKLFSLCTTICGVSLARASLEYLSKGMPPVLLLVLPDSSEGCLLDDSAVPLNNLSCNPCTALLIPEHHAKQAS